MKSRKIRIYPDADQRALLRRGCGISRFVYNRTVACLQAPGTQAHGKAIKTGILHGLPNGCADVPDPIQSVAMRDACQAVKEAKRRNRKGNGSHRVRFRTRKDAVPALFIPASAIRERGVYHTQWGDLYDAEPLPAAPRDSRLTLLDGRYPLRVPFAAPVSPAETQGRIVALDPGVRTFQIFYRETAIGSRGLCPHRDHRLSRAAARPHRRQRHMYRAAARMRQKIRDRVDELHHRATHWLTAHYDILLLLALRVRGMSRRAERNIRRQTMRHMLTLRHYRFPQFLRHKAAERGKMVLEVNEAYTSRTCSGSGEIIPHPGGRKAITGSDGYQRRPRDLSAGFGRYPLVAGLPAVCTASCLHVQVGSAKK